MVLLKRIFLLLAFISLLNACRKPTSANWDVDAVVPLVNSELNIKNFAGDSIFDADNTGLLSFHVTREIFTIKLDSIIKLPDTTIVNTFTIPAIIPTKFAPGQSLTFFPSSELKFSISNGVELKTTDIRKGTLTIKFKNDLTQDIDIIYKIPSAVKNGAAFTIKETVPPLPATLTKTYDLASYSFNMRGLSGNVYNTIVQSNTIALNPNADTALVTYGQGLKTEISYQDIVADYIDGYFGQQTIDIPLDTANINLVENFSASNFMLYDATLNFKILNDFGAEFASNLSNIKSINVGGTNVVPLATKQLSNINIDRATKAGTNVFNSTKVISLTSANSNIVPFLSNIPNKLTYQGSVQINPKPLPENISGYNDFAFYNKGIRVLAEIIIPLRFNTNNFILKSTTDVDFTNIKQLDNVKSGNLVILVKNGYPFKTTLQAYLLNAQNQVLDSLFVPSQNSIESGQVDSQNIVVATTNSKILVPLDAEKIKKLKQSKFIQVVTKFIMPPNPPDIKIYENYKYNVNIVAELNYNVSRK
jgi:hypothetical protein